MREYFTIKKIKNGMLFLHTYGLKLLVKETLMDILHKPWLFSTKRYKAWIKQNEPGAEALLKQKEVVFSNRPKISVVVPVFNSPLLFLSEMITSVLNQTYPHWELCIADGGSTTPGTTELLLEACEKDNRIKVVLLKDNKGIAGNSNEALSLSTGEYVAFLDHDDTLSPFALFEIVKAINDCPESDLIYSDEDLISEDGQIRFKPHFKPDWSPDNLRSCNYITHLMVIRRSLLNTVGGFREEVEGSQDYDMVLRASESAQKIVHVPQILYHWRVNANSCATRPENKLYAYESAKKALADHLQRIGLSGHVKHGVTLGLYEITFSIDNPRVSIIIPNLDRTGDLVRCVKSILIKSTYRNFDLLIVGNGAVDDGTMRLPAEIGTHHNIRTVAWKKPFNYSIVNNYAVRCVGGEILLFLNSSMEVISHDWIERMLEHAVRKDVGAVGAKLYYRDNTIQHAGIILGREGKVLHSHRFYPRFDFGYRARLKMVQDVSAVTGACTMMRRKVFEEAGGFDEGYDASYGDIDLCMKLRQQGYVNIWTPYAELYHDEREKGGCYPVPDKKAQTQRDEARLRSKWREVLSKSDPYYSPNLTQDKEDFSLRII